jgi:hypothetical protein
MIDFDRTILTADGHVIIEDNVIGYSVEPTNDNLDDFKYGINTNSPDILVKSGRGGRNHGFLAPLATGYQFVKPGKVKVVFQNLSPTKGCLIIKTVYLPDC